MTTLTNSRLTERRRYRQRGSGLVEGALCFSAFLFITFGVMEFAMAIYAYNFCSYAAQDAARWASTRGANYPTPVCLDGCSESCDEPGRRADQYRKRHHHLDARQQAWRDGTGYGTVQRDSTDRSDASQQSPGREYRPDGYQQLRRLRPRPSQQTSPLTQSRPAKEPFRILLFTLSAHATINWRHGTAAKRVETSLRPPEVAADFGTPEENR